MWSSCSLVQEYLGRASRCRWGRPGDQSPRGTKWMMDKWSQEQDRVNNLWHSGSKGLRNLWYFPARMQFCEMLLSKAPWVDPIIFDIISIWRFFGHNACLEEGSVKVAIWSVSDLFLWAVCLDWIGWPASLMCLKGIVVAQNRKWV